MKQMFSSSKLLILDFEQIPEGTEHDANIETYFHELEAKNLNPREAKNRQSFNDKLLDSSGFKYLVSRYAEDRSSIIHGSTIAKEGRTIHLGVDVFCKDTEVVYAPCDGTIIEVGQEPEDHSFGYYLVLEPDDKSIPIIFLGHLGSKLIKKGRVEAGQELGKLGDFMEHENGGWSRHLHIQMLSERPKEGVAPIGYSTESDLKANRNKFPDPIPYFPEWKISGINS